MEERICLWGWMLNRSGDLRYLSIWYSETRLSVAMVVAGVLDRVQSMVASSEAFTLEVGHGRCMRRECEVGVEVGWWTYTPPPTGVSSWDRGLVAVVTDPSVYAVEWLNRLGGVGVLRPGGWGVVWLLFLVVHCQGLDRAGWLAILILWGGVEWWSGGLGVHQVRSWTCMLCGLMRRIWRRSVSHCGICCLSAWAPS